MFCCTPLCEFAYSRHFINCSYYIVETAINGDALNCGIRNHNQIVSSAKISSYSLIRNNNQNITELEEKKISLNSSLQFVINMNVSDKETALKIRIY